LEYAVMAFAVTSYDEDEPKYIPQIKRALEMLLWAARSGNTQARGFVGWFHDTFHESLPWELNTEHEWLVEATTSGSRVARRRLLQLNASKHEAVLGIIRTRYQGIGGRVWEILESEVELINRGMDREGGTGSTLVVMATVGDLPRVRRLIDSWSVSINEQDGRNETALLAACRAGHADVVEFLLSKGADPTLCSNRGISPLHFLAAFDEDKIAKIAFLLKENGADLEARSMEGGGMESDKDPSDTCFGRFHGTPLLWAVGSNCYTATEVLVRLGADPFDDGGVDLASGLTWGTIVHDTPVHLAARLHQYKLLELLFSSSTLKSTDALKVALNSSYRLAGNKEGSPGSLPLMWAVTYCGGIIFEQLLIHGPPTSWLASILLKCYSNLEQIRFESTLRVPQHLRMPRWTASLMH
jgi:hypothetical protein